MMTAETQQLACQRVVARVATTREQYARQWQTSRENAILDHLDAELTYLAPGDAVGKVEAIRAAAADLVRAGAR